MCIRKHSITLCWVIYLWGILNKKEHGDNGTVLSVKFKQFQTATTEVKNIKIKCCATVKTTTKIPCLLVTFYETEVGSRFFALSRFPTDCEH